MIEGSGKTLLPGLIDAGVRLTSPGGVYKSPVSNDPREMMLREMAAYLYSGVTGVLSGGDPRALLQSIRSRLDRGERLGAELFLPGLILATEGGSGAGPLEVLGGMSGFLTENQGVRPAGTPEEARRQVKHLDEAGVVGIEHGSAREEIPAGTFLVMARRGAAYCPALSVSEAYSQVAAGRASALERSLVLQSAPAELVEGTRKFLQSPNLVAMRAKLAAAYPKSFEVGKQNLRRASAAGVMLVAGSNAGSFLVFHGPAIHRELQLWVEAGIPPADALQAATYNAARLLRAGDRIGLVAEGHDADLLLVDGNPLQDISATERISLVIFKGERVNRPGLFEQE